MKRWVRPLVLSGASALLMAGLVSCAGSSALPEESSSGSALIDLIQVSGVIDPAQQAILDDVASTGEVTIEQLREAIDATGACMESAGLVFMPKEEVDWSGLPTISYVYGTPHDGGVGRDEMDRLGEDCIQRFSIYVERAYAFQPSSVAMENAALEGARPAILECLRSRGAVIEDDASTAEILQANVQDVEASGGSGDDCISLALGSTP